VQKNKKKLEGTHSEKEKLEKIYQFLRIKEDWNLTLKGSLSVLKLIPGMYFSQTGKPLKTNKKNMLRHF